MDESQQPHDAAIGRVGLGYGHGVEIGLPRAAQAIGPQSGQLVVGQQSLQRLYPARWAALPLAAGTPVRHGMGRSAARLITAAARIDNGVQKAHSPKPGEPGFGLAA